MWQRWNLTLNAILSTILYFCLIVHGNSKMVLILESPYLSWTFNFNGTYSVISPEMV